MSRQQARLLAQAMEVKRCRQQQQGAPKQAGMTRSVASAPALSPALPCLTTHPLRMSQDRKGFLSMSRKRCRISSGSLPTFRASASSAGGRTAVPHPVQPGAAPAASECVAHTVQRSCCKHSPSSWIPCAPAGSDSRARPARMAPPAAPLPLPPLPSPPPPPPLLPLLPGGEPPPTDGVASGLLLRVHTCRFAARKWSPRRCAGWTARDGGTDLPAPVLQQTRREAIIVAQAAKGRLRARA